MIKVDREGSFIDDQYVCLHKDLVSSRNTTVKINYVVDGEKKDWVERDVLPAYQRDHLPSDQLCWGPISDDALYDSPYEIKKQFPNRQSPFTIKVERRKSSWAYHGDEEMVVVSAKKEKWEFHCQVDYALVNCRRQDTTAPNHPYDFSKGGLTNQMTVAYIISPDEDPRDTGLKMNCNGKERWVTKKAGWAKDLYDLRIWVAISPKCASDKEATVAACDNFGNCSEDISLNDLRLYAAITDLYDGNPLSIGPSTNDSYSEVEKQDTPYGLASSISVAAIGQR